MRTCTKCGIDISGRGPTAKYCEKCSYETRLQQMRAAVERRLGPNKGPADCAECGEKITGRSPNAKYCWDCLPKAKARVRAEYERSTKSERPGRSCVECGRDISDRYIKAKYCLGCADLVKDRQSAECRRRKHRKNPEPAICLACGKSMPDRHRNTKYCVDCSEDKRRAKDKRVTGLLTARICLRCGKPTGKSYRARYCDPCCQDRNREYQKNRQASIRKEHKRLVEVEASVTIRDISNAGSFEQMQRLFDRIAQHGLGGWR